MKKNSETTIRNKAQLLKNNNLEIEREVEDQPVRLGDKDTGDKLLHINNPADAVLNDISSKSKLPRNKSGSHSLSELRSFRSK